MKSKFSIFVKLKCAEASETCCHRSAHVDTHVCSGESVQSGSETHFDAHEAAGAVMHSSHAPSTHQKKDCI